MAIERFKLESLTKIDNGRIEVAFAQALKRCEADCIDRPAIEKARTITFDVQLVPLCSSGGELESVDVSFKIREKLPNRESATYNMKATRGGLLFNELSPDDVHQATLDQVPAPQPLPSREA